MLLKLAKIINVSVSIYLCAITFDKIKQKFIISILISTTGIILLVTDLINYLTIKEK